MTQLLEDEDGAPYPDVVQAVVQEWLAEARRQGAAAGREQLRTALQRAFPARNFSTGAVIKDYPDWVKRQITIEEVLAILDVLEGMS